MTPDDIRKRARALGFDACGFASAADAWPAGARLAQFVEAGRHGDMAWMEETLERRAHPTAMWPEAKSAVVVGMTYGPATDPLEGLSRRSNGLISAYARGDDYHGLIKGRLKNLGGWIKAKFGGEVKVFVDTAPLMEKPLAERAGLGWQGKHTNLVSRELGSWLFLGSVLTSINLPLEAPGEDACGTCRACLDICPTSAFPAPYQLDARRCISYLTIEHEGPVDAALRPALGNRIYGCDDCLAVCPWNKFAVRAREMGLRARPELDEPALAELAGLDDEGFRRLFRKSAVTRIGRDRLVRNVLYAAGNSGDPSLVPVVEARLADANPVVRGAAVWALKRLAPARAAVLRATVAETDPAVVAEWDQAL
ncbi:tRNA epoxyqueuosine(34) reductase QueG [Caulobacter sp. NIBR1757]|uniref:tRNA epoxyqueuosine(34) reductase QueG n=1 Tax=Caulobacter sp. NIBR1757 TaxID=3016000 RepID=UPI0022F0B97D|nr:tRNA epoxyqueuosine(34) reductase QueG [Caulobacter sp. NIBR1757]WGM41185.1 Epoxyqueuosine reductase [Caulobacter sp. NIBR1757]